MIKVSDYIFRRLAEYYGVRHIFMITGGGAMHLNDSIGHTPSLEFICQHHEQALAIAAEGYSRANDNKLAVVNVTTGPGGLNTLTGVMGQWTDSVPVLYISGQVKQSTTIAACPELNLRQLGDQEVDIISVVKPLTKYAKTVTNAKQIKEELDRAIFYATEGRPGPVWLDIPMDIQAALIDEKELTEFAAPSNPLNDTDLTNIFDLLEKAERPIIIAGNGIKVSQSKTVFLELLKQLNIPVVTTFNGMDILTEEHPQYVGRIGTLGNRSGNFALQNADVVLCLGSRNNIRQTSYNYEFFAREGKLILVDVDENEMKKPTVKPYLTVKANLKDVLPKMLSHFQKQPLKRTEWIDWCLVRKQKYPSVLPEYSTKEEVHPYYFLEQLSERIKKESIFVCGNGTACVGAFQAMKVLPRSRYIWNSGCASMGYDLPAAIGAAVAKPNEDIYCIAGDGSLMMNLQELETMSFLNLNIKLILLDNGGYISIKQTQHNFFNGREYGCGIRSGVGFPNFERVAKAFDIPTLIIEKTTEISKKIDQITTSKGPLFVIVKTTQDYIFSPKVSSAKRADGSMVSKPLEDLFPFLPREDFLENMIIKPIEE